MQLGTGYPVHGRQVRARDPSSRDLPDDVAVGIEHLAPRLCGVSDGEALFGATDHLQRSKRVHGLDDPHAVDRRVQVRGLFEDVDFEALLSQRDGGAQTSDTTAEDQYPHRFEKVSM